MFHIFCGMILLAFPLSFTLNSSILASIGLIVNPFR